jgi:hypothetical protein
MARRAYLSARGARRLSLAVLGAVALIASQAVSGISAGFTTPVSVLAAAPAPTAHPNRFVPGASMKSVNHLPAPPKPPPGLKPTFSQPKGPAPVPMQPARVPLDPGAGAHFVGSDGVLEVTVPPGAVTAQDVQAARGSLNLLVRQVEPGSGSSAGGSGHVSFGTWLVQVVDGSGRLVSHGLRQSPQVKLHQSQHAAAVNLAHTQVLVNPPLPTWVNLDPGPTVAGLAPAAGTRQQTQTQVSGARQQTPAAGSRQQASAGASAAPSSTAAPALGPASHQSAALDPTTATLSSTVAMASASTSMSFGTNASVATFGKPDPFETDLAGGSLTAGIQLDLPAGPGGLTPPLTLGYSSAGVSDQHNPQGAAPWVGEGWNMSLGAISWAEHQVDLTGCQQCTQTQWENSWQLSDAFGTGANLLPPDITVSSYLDDTGNAISATPVVWHTAPETHAQVVMYSSGIGMPANAPGAPCWRVFLPNGIMEEFGCTANSIQFYPQQAGNNANKPYIANWLLDMIVDPQGNQIHVTYQGDDVPESTMTYTRDLQMATVEYDSPGCLDAQHMCTTTWVPQMRVNFVASPTVAHPVNTSCAANGALRCDDPADLSGSAGVAAPLVQSTFVLNDAQVQVRPNGSSPWSTLRDYRFGYDQTAPPGPITDPVSGTAESVAGSLLLKSLQVVGADGATAQPARTFGYTTQTEYYEDVTHSPAPTTN